MASNLIYISGPISDDPDYFAKFAAVEDYLTQRGCPVLNPARMFDGIAKAGAGYGQIMNLCLALVRQADCIALLPDWKHSPGANAELEAYFHRRNLPRVLSFALVRDNRSGRWVVQPTHE